MSKRIAVFISGRGSNFKAILDEINQGNINGKIDVVVSDNPGAYGLLYALKNNIKYVIYIKGKEESRANYFNRIKLFLHKRDIDLIVLAGFGKILSVNFVQHYENKILNIHPALLPSFPGEDAQQQALKRGVKYSGCTVHFVDEGVDTGPIVLQTPVLVHDNDTVEELSNRILIQEHVIYPRAVRYFCDDKLLIKGGKVIII